MPNISGSKVNTTVDMNKDVWGHGSALAWDKSETSGKSRMKLTEVVLSYVNCFVFFLKIFPGLLQVHIT